MSALRELWSRVLSMVGATRRDDTLTEELQHHLELLTQEYRAKGLPDAEARAAARQSLGNEWHTQEAYRRQSRLPSIDSLITDVRFAVRRLRRDLGTTLSAVILLTLGVTASLLTGDVLDRLLLRPPAAVGTPERAKRLYVAFDHDSPGALVTNYATVDGLATGAAGAFESVACYMTQSAGLGRGRDARQLSVVAYSTSYFDVLSLKPALGTLPLGSAGAAPDAAVISYGLWQRAFGGDSGAIGKPLRLGANVFTIRAVTPKGFAGIDDDPTDAWVPLAAIAEARLGPTWRMAPSYFMLRVVSRLRPGIQDTAAESLASTAYRAGTQPDFSDGKKHTAWIVLGELPAARQPGGTREIRVAMWIAAVAGLVMLIACGNVGNLLLARGLRHAAELALKTSFGATRLRLMREILIEAALLAGAAGVASLLLVLWLSTAAGKLLLPPAVVAEGVLSPRLLILACGISILATLLLGVVPAFRLTSVRILNPAHAFQNRASWAMDVFTGLQVALSVPPVIAALLFASSLWHAKQVNFGLQTTNVSVLSMNADELGSAVKSHDAHRRAAERLALLYEVQGVSLVQTVPMRGVYATMFQIAGPHTEPGRSIPYVNGVDPSYFNVMGMHFVAGHNFTNADNVKGGNPVMVINEAFAKAYWPGQNPLGHCAVVGTTNKACAVVVGVVADTSMWPWLEFAHHSEPSYFVPVEQYGDLNPQRAILVRTTTLSETTLPMLRRQVQSSGPSLPYIDVWSFDDVFQPSLRPLRLGAQLFVVLGALGVVIACAGLATVTGYAVTRRTRELGIRAALGASTRDLVFGTVAQSLAAVAIGLVVGTICAYGSSHWLKTLLFEMDPAIPILYVAVALLLLGMASLSAFVPARRAGQLNPVEALRQE
jgi:putative ABC transport system permease protein